MWGGRVSLCCCPFQGRLVARRRAHSKRRCRDNSNVYVRARRHSSRVRTPRNVSVAGGCARCVCRHPNPTERSRHVVLRGATHRRHSSECLGSQSWHGWRWAASCGVWINRRHDSHVAVDVGGISINSRDDIRRVRRGTKGGKRCEFVFTRCECALVSPRLWWLASIVLFAIVAPGTSLHKTVPRRPTCKPLQSCAAFPHSRTCRLRLQPSAHMSWTSQTCRPHLKPSTTRRAPGIGCC